MTKELSIRCDASTVQGTSEANHDTYGSYFDSPNRRSLLWVIDGATPLEKEPYPSALYHIVRQLSATIEYKFKWYADRCQRVGLQQVLSEAIDQMRDAVALIAPTHGINSMPTLMEGDNYKPTDADDAFWTSFGTFSITMIELDNDKPVINECLQLGDCGLLVDDMYCSDRRVHKFRSIIDHEEDRKEGYKIVRAKANQPDGYYIGDLSGRGVSHAIIRTHIPVNDRFTIMSDGFYDIWNRYGDVQTSINELQYKKTHNVSRDDATFITGVYTYRDDTKDPYTFMLYGHTISSCGKAPIINTKEDATCD